MARSATPSSSAREPARHGRLDWIDALRGFAVLLVVYYHAVVGLSVTQEQAPPWMSFISNGLAPLRMPTLMLVSGLLLSRSLSKPLPVYVLGKVRNIAWPWLVWTTITAALWAVGSRAFGDGRYTVDDAMAVFFGPKTYTWYLAYLMVFYLIAVLVPARFRPWLAFAALAVATVVADGEGWSRFTSLLAFFLIGELIARKRWPEGFAQRGWVVLASLLVVALMSWVGTVLPIRYTAYSAPGVLALALLAAGAWKFIAGTFLGAGLLSAGRNSIVYYLTHWPVMALGAHALNRIDVPNGAVAVMLLMVVGLVTSAVAVALRNRSPVIACLYALPALDVSRKLLKPRR